MYYSFYLWSHSCLFKWSYMLYGKTACNYHSKANVLEGLLFCTWLFLGIKYIFPRIFLYHHFKYMATHILLKMLYYGLWQM
jgi:hypothetical protein